MTPAELVLQDAWAAWNHAPGNERLAAARVDAVLAVSAERGCSWLVLWRDLTAVKRGGATYAEAILGTRAAPDADETAA